MTINSTLKNFALTAVVLSTASFVAAKNGSACMRVVLKAGEIEKNAIIIGADRIAAVGDLAVGQSYDFAGFYGNGSPARDFLINGFAEPDMEKAPAPVASSAKAPVAGAPAAAVAQRAQRTQRTQRTVQRTATPQAANTNTPAVADRAPAAPRGTTTIVATLGDVVEGIEKSERKLPFLKTSTPYVNKKQEEVTLRVMVFKDAVVALKDKMVSGSTMRLTGNFFSGFFSVLDAEPIAA